MSVRFLSVLFAACAAFVSVTMAVSFGAAYPGGVVVVNEDGPPPRLKCPLHKDCEVYLKLGEIVSDAFVMDPRFQVDWTSSGAAVPFVSFKPRKSSVSTVAVIATNQRSYHIDLQSVDSGVAPMIRFEPPAKRVVATPASMDRVNAVDDTAYVRALAAVADRSVPVAGVCPDYRVEGRGDFKPLFAFHDDVRTYFAMPRATSVSVAPTLRAFLPDGKAEAISASPQGRFLVVDRLAQKFEFRAGDGRGANVVIVTWGC